MTVIIDAPQAMEESAAVKRDAVVIGRVVSTAGSQIVALLRGDVGDHGGVQMGSLVSIRSTHATVYGLINGMNTRMPLMVGEDAELRLAEICLLGEVADHAVGGNASFRRGISVLPSLDARVCAVDHEEMAVIYALPGRPTVCIGSVHHDPRVPARIAVDELLSKHFALLGTTGSGKSCGVTIVLKRILEQSPEAHVLMLDPHGEYGHAFGPQAELLTIENFRLPYWLFTFDEFTEVLFGKQKVEMAAEAMCLRDIVVAAKLKSAARGTDPRRITVDSPVPYMFSDLVAQLDLAIGRLNRGHLSTYLRLKEALTTLRTDRRFEFMFETGMTVRQSRWATRPDVPRAGGRKANRNI